MLVIKELEKNTPSSLVTLGDDEILKISGGNPLGAAAGATGGVIGKVVYNTQTGKPLTEGVAEQALSSGAFGSRNPVSSVPAFAVGVAQSAATAYGLPTATDAVAPIVKNEANAIKYNLMQDGTAFINRGR